LVTSGMGAQRKYEFWLGSLEKRRYYFDRNLLFRLVFEEIVILWKASFFV